MPFTHDRADLARGTPVEALSPHRSGSGSEESTINEPTVLMTSHDDRETPQSRTLCTRINHVPALGRDETAQWQRLRRQAAASLSMDDGPHTCAHSRPASGDQIHGVDHTVDRLEGSR
jgi:hypothetical protein